MTSACSDPDTATINVSTLVLSALAYYAWKRGLDECEQVEAPETIHADVTVAGVGGAGVLLHLGHCIRRDRVADDGPRSKREAQ